MKDTNKTMANSNLLDTCKLFLPRPFLWRPLLPRFRVACEKGRADNTPTQTISVPPSRRTQPEIDAWGPHN